MGFNKILLSIAVVQSSQNIAYFNFVNRIALGLGVASSEAEISGYKV